METMKATFSPDEVQPPNNSRNRAGVKISPENILRIAFMVAALTLILVSGLSVYSLLQFRAQSEKVGHTLEVSGQVNRVLLDVIEIQGSVRGYIITGDERFIEPYIAARAMVDKDVRRLRSLASDDPVKQQRVDELETLIAQRLSYATQQIELRRTKGYQAAQKTVAQGIGQAITDQIRRRAADFVESEQKLLSERSLQTKNSALYTLAAILSLGLLTIVILGLTARYIRRDTAVRKQAEKERDRMFNYSLDIYGIANFNGYFIQVNPAWEQTLGWKAAELLARPYLEFVHPDDRDATTNAASELVDGKIIYFFDNRYVCKDGTYKWISWVSYPLAEEGLIFAVGRDITERKRVDAALREAHDEMETRVRERTSELATLNETLRQEALHRQQAAEELRASEQRVRLATEATEVGIWEWNVINNNIHWDAQMFLIYGVPKTADGFIEYSQWSTAVCPEELSQQEQILQDTVRRCGHSIREFRIRRPGEQEYRLIRAVETVRTNAQGQAEWVVGTNQDITERRRIEAELQKSHDELESKVIERTTQLSAKNEELKGFAYTVSHDLKAPLRGITGYAQELERRHKEGLAERAQFCITQIITASKNLDSLIEDLLKYSRLDTETPTLGKVTLADLVQSILNDRSHTLTEQGVVVNLSIPPITLHLWERGLHQVLANLIDNAIKYSRHAQPPQLTISADKAGGKCRITVTDNGIGFDMKYHDRIFGLFNRLVRSNEFEGTGAGLAIAKKLLEKLGGTIQAQSAPGQGATFSVELPLNAG